MTGRTWADLQRRVGAKPDGDPGDETLARIWAALDARAVPGQAAAAVPHQAAMIRHLATEEGRVPHAYQDHLGFWTIGIGRLIDRRKGGRLRESEIDLLLVNDIRAFIAEMEQSPVLRPAWEACRDNEARAVAMLSMCFQMGSAGLAKFTTTLRHLARREFPAAAASARSSLWARQTPARAARVTAMIETGRVA